MRYKLNHTKLYTLSAVMTTGSARPWNSFQYNKCTR